MKLSHTLVVLPALLLAACNSGSQSAPTPEKPTAVSSLSGVAVAGKFVVQGNRAVLQTSAWADGAGTVSFNVLGAAGGPLELDRTALSADGRFSFATLPTPKTGDLQKITAQDPYCTNTFTASDPAALNASAALFTSAQKNRRIDLVSYITSSTGATTINTGTLIYADRAVTVRGTQTCSADGLALVGDIDISLVQGWNMVTASGNAGSGTVTLRNGAPAGAQWMYVETPTGTTGLSLGRSLFR